MKAFASAMLVCLFTSVRAQNSVANGGFESGLDGWNNDGGRISSESHEGAGALVVRQANPRWSGAWQKVSIPEGVRQVRASGWLRSDSLRGGKENWERGRLSIEFHKADGDTVGGYPLAIGQVRGRTPWTRMERVYPVPLGARWLKLECALGNATGTLFCDDLTVVFER